MTASCFLRFYHYICCLGVRWSSGLYQSFGTYGCQKLIYSNCTGLPSDYLEEEGQSLLFPSLSNSKGLQSKVSLHVGDTSRTAFSVILFDEVSCMSLDVF